MGQCDELESLEVERADLRDGVRHLLAVGADVLDGRAPHSAWDSREALDATDSLLAELEDEGVPVCPRSSGDVEKVSCGARQRGVGDGHVEHEAVEAGIADEQVAAAA